MKYLAIAAILFLAACKVEPSPSRWSAELNPYMEARGYTLAMDGETILKNGYPVWIDPICIGRGCGLGNQPLVPYELSGAVKEDLLRALKEAREEYIEDVSEKIGVEPLPQVEPKEETK